MTQECSIAHGHDLEGTRYQKPLIRSEQTQIITIMVASFTEVADIADSKEESNPHALFVYGDLIGKIVREHNGSLLQTSVGCVTACFYVAQDALRAAIRVQNCVDERNIQNTPSVPVLVRIGLHTGQGTACRQDPERNIVAVAEYCESIAHGGEINLTEDTLNSLHDRNEVYSLFMKTVTLRAPLPNVFNIYNALWNPTEIEVDISCPRNPAGEDVKSIVLPACGRLAIGLLTILACYLVIKLPYAWEKFHSNKNYDNYQRFNLPTRQDR